MSSEIVRASAGTGKTFTLTNRYLQLMLQGEPPSSVLATTFTRMAAGEILRKMLERLSLAATGNAATLAELQEHVHPGITRETCESVAATISRSVHRLRVMTLDALMLRAASAFSLEIGIVPGWSIVEDERDEDLRDEAIGRALREFAKDELFVLLRTLHKGELRRDVHVAVSRVVRNAHDEWRKCEPGAWEVLQPAGTPLSRENLLDAIDRLRTAPCPRTKAGKESKRWRGAIDTALHNAEREDWRSMLSAGVAKPLLKGEETFASMAITQEIRDVFQPLIEHARAALLTKHHQISRAMGRLLAKFDEAYLDLKRDAGLYRFDDMPRLLLHAEAGHALGDLYYRMDGWIRHILLDEFQDTSRTQFAFLEPMLDEVLTDVAEGRSVLCVGDVKQSLYAWREAEPRLLEHLGDRWPHFGSGRELHRSYRSSPAIVDAVNAVFEHLGESSLLREHPDTLAHWQGIYTTHETALDVPGHVQFAVAEAPGDAEDNDPDWTQAIISDAARRVQRIAAADPGATIGILVRTGKHIPRLLLELSRLGVMASEEGGNPLTDAPPVALALSLLRLADHPGDSASFHHLATSPCATALGLSPEDDAFKRVAFSAQLRRRLLHEGYAGTLGSLLDVAASSMDRRGLLRFGQLIELAHEFDARAGLRPIDFVNVVERRGVEEPGGLRIRVMTIHKSKGLEFDAVVLPDLENRWQLRNSDVLLARDDPFRPAQVASPLGDTLLRSLDPTLGAMYRETLGNRISEELCALYVAMTRAKRIMHMIIGPPRQGADGRRSAAGVLRATLAPDVEPTPGAMLWQTRHGDAASTARQSAVEGSAGPPITELRLARPTGSSPWRLGRTRPTATHPDVAVEPSLRMPSESGIDRGLLMHTWFEHVGWLEDGLPDENALRRIAGEIGASVELTEEVLPLFAEALRRPEVRGVLSREQGDAPTLWDADHELRREWPFAVRITDGDAGRSMVMTGRFDRLVIRRSEGRVSSVEVIDFKTDAITDDGAEDRLVAQYTQQMSAYRQAAATIFGLHRDQVEVRLVLTATGRVLLIAD
ncbi:MAG: UvrD-helicase domain-containing protein [Planctomycetota bacterium]